MAAAAGKHNRSIKLSTTLPRTVDVASKQAVRVGVARSAKLPMLVIEEHEGACRLRRKGLLVLLWESFMKFGYVWTFVNKPRGETPAPPPEKRAPALPSRRLACGIRIGPPHTKASKLGSDILKPAFDANRCWPQPPEAAERPELLRALAPSAFRIAPHPAGFTSWSVTKPSNCGPPM
jgi:hypothetical protein